MSMPEKRVLPGTSEGSEGFAAVKIYSVAFWFVKPYSLVGGGTNFT